MFNLGSINLPSHTLASTAPAALDASVFTSRQQQVLASMPSNSVAIIPNAEEVTRSNDTEYVFRGHSDFNYLAGFPEPEAVLVLVKPELATEDPQRWLFVRPKDATREIWDGYRFGPEAAQERFGVDSAFVLDALENELLPVLSGCSHLYFRLGEMPEWDTRVIGWLNQLRRGEKSGKRAPSTLVDVKPLIHAQRLIKSDREIELLKHAAEISAYAHCAAMQVCQPQVNEYQLEAELLYRFAQAGARQAAYTTIVGGGANACVLHYIENNQPLNDGDLVLIDAGCEYQGYAADITRTFPVNGQFSEPQKALYSLVLDAQEAAIAAVKPGVTWPELLEISLKILVAGLVRLGLLQGDVDTLIQEKAYTAFFMHGIGHWLGMDVHDVGNYRLDDGQPIPFEAGMYLTIEPGLYISPENTNVDPKWRGVGIRIEDNVLVTAQGQEVLTRAVPKTIEAVESLMAEVG